MAVADMHKDERLRRQRMRSVAIGLGLGALVVVFYIVTIVRLGPNALKRESVGKPAHAQAASGALSASDAATVCRKAGTC
jgi:hypothetical protein